MNLHTSSKLFTLGLISAVLIAAFHLPESERSRDVRVTPSVQVLRVPLAVSPPLLQGPVAAPVLRVKATGYNSLASQTDATPSITATGERTRFGIVAVSRDLLRSDVPYGSLVRIKDLGTYRRGRGAGAHQAMLDSQDLFIVEDTMHPRKRQQVDVWFPRRTEALHWGVRQAEIEVVRYGRSGPELYSQAPSDFASRPVLPAVR